VLTCARPFVLGVNFERGRTRWLMNAVWRTTGSPAVEQFRLVSQMQVRF
jgi:hypothetical protein